MKKIGVLTSGGDSQGMNAAVYATVRAALSAGLTVYAIRRGYQGLIDGDIEKMSANSVDDIAHRGGTVLGTSRCPAMKTAEGQQIAVANLRKYGIEGLVVIGGDGSFAGANVLSTQYGIKVIGIPGTIDNDLGYTEFSLGFDSAVAVVADNVNMLRDTMSSNNRTCLVEVMGRECGDIAMFAALACGADAVLVPELPYDPESVARTVKHNAEMGKTDNIILVAEGIRFDGELIKGRVADRVMADLLQRLPDLNVRTVVLGPLQRSGNATVRDRLLGIRMGAHAVKCLVQGKTGRVIGVKNDAVFDEEIVTALAEKKVFNREVYELANSLAKY